MNWVHELSVGWLIVVVFAGMSLGTAGIYGAVTRVAVGERARAFKALSPGMLPSMGLVFGLIVGFHVAGLWSELGEARNAVNREASSLRSADLVAGASFPGPTKARIDALIGRHIHDTVAREWPVMARGDATLKVVPAPLADALRVALEIEPHGENEVTAQRELVSSLQGALDARRQLIILSGSTVNWLRWTGVIALAFLTLLTIGLAHSENRMTTAIAMGLFASAVAVTLVMIAAQDRPFSGEFGVKPDVLLHALPRGR
jgi:hypothetical protein